MEPYQLPRAYPDELWYSRLSRYHRRSGNLRTYTTMHELGTRLINANHKVGIFNSNSFMLSFYEARNDEAGYWKAVEENTLDPFSLRFFTVEKRKEYYESLHSNHRKTIRLLHPMEEPALALRYCPLCYQEDMNQYGESYWHRLHQIPAVTICPKHLCQILRADISITSPSTKYLYCADEYTCPETTVTPMLHPEQLGPIRYMQQMLDSPYDVNVEESIDGLKEILFENGYMYITKNKTLWFRGQSKLKLRQDIIDKYGDYGAHIFTSEGKRIQLFRLICSRTMFTAERYALLMDFFGIPFKEAIHPQEDLIYNSTNIKMLLDMTQSGYLWNKSKAAEKLGIKSEQLQRLTKRLNIPRFWGPIDSDQQEKRTSLNVPVSTMKLINKRVRELGTYNIETYILYAIQKEQEANSQSKKSNT